MKNRDVIVAKISLNTVVALYVFNLPSVVFFCCLVFSTLAFLSYVMLQFFKFFWDLSGGLHGGGPV